MNKIEALKRKYLALSEDDEVDFTDTSNPLIQDYLKDLATLSESDLDQFSDWSVKDTEKTISQAFNSMINLPIQS